MVMLNLLLLMCLFLASRPRDKNQKDDKLSNIEKKILQKTTSIRTINRTIDDLARKINKINEEINKNNNKISQNKSEVERLKQNSEETQSLQSIKETENKYNAENKKLEQVNINKNVEIQNMDREKTRLESNRSALVTDIDALRADKVAIKSIQDKPLDLTTDSKKLYKQ